MKRILIALLVIFFPLCSSADTLGMQGFTAVRQCVMQNDVNYCHAHMTPESYALFDRFVSYKLMPCLPTDFTYVSEEAKPQNQIMLKISMPAGGGQLYILRLAFAVTPQGPKLDIPASLQRGLGQDWQNKLTMSEQLYLMMKQNMGDKLTCDMLNGLVKPHQ